MRKLLRFEHGLRMDQGGVRESGIEFERRCASLLPGLIGQFQEPLFSSRFGVKRDIGRFRRSGLQHRLLVLPKPRFFGSHQMKRWPHRYNGRPQQKGQQ